MKLLAWNIQAGGARRAAALVDGIRSLDPDVMVLTEVRPSSSPLLERLNDGGWPHTITGDLTPRIGGVAVVSRVPLASVDPGTPGSILPGRWLEADIPEFNVRVAGVYGPLQKEPYQDFWRDVCELVPKRIDMPFLLAGDLNTGRSLVDAPKKNFFCSAHFERLQDLGLVDLWRSRNMAAYEFSYHHRIRDGVDGSGFRLDHALASAPLAARLISVEYEHSLRQKLVSDHAPLVARFSS